VLSPEARFDDAGLRSWIEAPRGRHSEKPEIVRRLIERASPSPRLELFARRLTPGWYAWGHELELPLCAQDARVKSLSKF
jgi:N6-adenosine-specific RNA methylase IME4